MLRARHRPGKQPPTHLLAGCRTTSLVEITAQPDQQSGNVDPNRTDVGTCTAQGARLSQVFEGCST